MIEDPIIHEVVRQVPFHRHYAKHVLVVLQDPTQFDVPFFRWVAAHGDGLNVLYIRGDRFDGAFFDAELGRSVSWERDLASGYPHCVLPARKRVRCLVRRVASARHDLVVVAGYRNPLLLLAAVAARLGGSLVALRLDTVAFGDQRRTKQASKRLLYFGLKRIFHTFLAAGESTHAFLLTMGVAPERIGRFPYSIDVDDFRRRSVLSLQDRLQLRHLYGLTSDRTVVLSVTKFTEREAPWDLLRAAAMNERLDMQFWFVGDGPDRPILEQYAAKSGCDAVFSGYVPFRELPEVYAAADIFVHPARFEPWGVSIQEAAACGLPVVASSHVGSAYDLITQGSNGYIYEAGDANDLRSKLDMLGRGADVETVRKEHSRQLRALKYDEIWASLQAVAGQR